VITKKDKIVRMHLPPDTNTLLSPADHCLRSRKYANVIVVGKQPALSCQSMDEAMMHFTPGLGIWPGFGNIDGGSAAVGNQPFSSTAEVGAQRE
jgi:xylulose-5-phosphate/fructose-6-phosphate phosphoketolase